MKYINNIDRKDCIGKVCESKYCGDFIITKYNNTLDVEVEFIKTGYRKNYEMSQIRTGQLKDPYFPSIYDVGVVGIKYPMRIRNSSGKYIHLEEYKIWCSMLSRCYSEKYHTRYKSYKDCLVSENFKHYEYFYEWCHDQVGFGNEGWQLDKDLLVKGNKVYSEEACIFLPREVNNIFIKRKEKRGEFPIGVSSYKENGKFIARLSVGNDVQKHLGLFETYNEAFYAYKEAKEKVIRNSALKWRDKIDIRAYKALMSYEVDIND